MMIEVNPEYRKLVAARTASYAAYDAAVSLSNRSQASIHALEASEAWKALTAAQDAVWDFEAEWDATNPE